VAPRRGKTPRHRESREPAVAPRWSRLCKALLLRVDANSPPLPQYFFRDVSCCHALMAWFAVGGARPLGARGVPARRALRRGRRGCSRSARRFVIPRVTGFEKTAPGPTLGEDCRRRAAELNRFNRPDGANPRSRCCKKIRNSSRALRLPAPRPAPGCRAAGGGPGGLIIVQARWQNRTLGKSGGARKTSRHFGREPPLPPKNWVPRSADVVGDGTPCPFRRASV